MAGLAPMTDLSTAQSLMTTWCADWNDGDYNRQIPCVVSSNETALIGFPERTDLVQVLNAQHLPSDLDAQIGEYREPETILIAGAHPCPLTAIVAQMGQYNFVILEDLNEVGQLSDKRFLPDIVILDNRMSEETCLAQCRYLKLHERLRQIPVIILGEAGDESAELTAFQAGAVDFAVKPLNPRVLSARITTQLSAKHSNDVLQQLATVDGLTDLPNRR